VQGDADAGQTSECDFAARAPVILGVFVSASPARDRRGGFETHSHLRDFEPSSAMLPPPARINE
jgi:hypothetical protein